MHFSLYLLTIGSVFLCAMVSASPHLEYNNDRTRILGCPIDAISFEEDCRPEPYKDDTLLAWAMPGIIMACALVLFSTIYAISKYVCDCCGGKRQSPNFCCPNRLLPAMYSRSDLVRPRFLGVATFIMCLAGCIWSCVGTTSLLGACRALTDSTDASISKIGAALEASHGTLAASHIGNTLLDNVTIYRAAAMEELWDMDSRTFVYLRHYIRQYMWTTYVVFPLVTVCSALGVLAAAFHMRKTISMSFFTLFVVLGILTWGIQGLLTATHYLVKDSCREVTAYAAQSPNVAAVVSQCRASVLADHTAAYALAAEEALRTACNALDAYCEGSAVACAQHCTWDTIFTWYTSAAAAVASDSDGELGQRVLSAMTLLGDLRTALSTTVASAGSCEAVLASVVPPLVLPCAEAVKGARDAMQGAGLVGLGVVVALGVYAWGAKRFIPLHESLNPQYGYRS